MYNAAYYEPNKLYRDIVLKNSNPEYANTIGRYHYPIKNAFNKFSQWAVYTEYQNLDVLGIELRSEINKPIAKKMDLNLKIETITIIREKINFAETGNRIFTHYFYELGLGYHFVENVKANIFLHNKTMNLDKSYQTVYMVKIPYIGFSVIKDL